MPFKVGDNVVHAVYGVGHITQVEERQFIKDKEPSLYYQGSFGTDSKISVWTAADTSDDTKLRRVTTERELDKYRDILRSRPVLPEHHYRSHPELTRRLQRGSFQVICEVVRDLTMLSWQKPLTSRNAATLKQVYERLLQEWAVAAGKSIGEVTREVGLLLKRDTKLAESDKR